MELKIGAFLLGVGVLAACEPVPEGSAGTDGFFATNIGRRVGQAEALAASCPSIRLNNVAVQQYKAAICQRLELGDGCSLPSFDSERQRLFSVTKASMAELTPEQACDYTRAEAANDGTLKSFLVGAGIPRAAVPVSVEAEPSRPADGGWFSL